MTETTITEWQNVPCVLELMEHRRLGGFVSEVEVFGGKLLRIDIPAPDETMQTQFYSASSLYCITPTTEDIARAVALRNQPQPVHFYELPVPADDKPLPFEPEPEDDWYIEED